MIINLDFLAVLADWPLLAAGVLWTLALTAIALVFGMLISIAGAWTRVNAPLWAAAPVAIYVEAIRNTPFIIQLFFLFFGLPSLGIRLSPPVASALALVLNLGAYGTEIIRAGLVATPRGQIEAGQSLALSDFQIFTRVILPPALKKVWPAMVSQTVIVMLGSSVCGQIATEELSYAANVISANTFRTFESFIIATLIYLALSIALRRALNWAGPRFIFGGRNHG
jgi:polar amino acid transport system permease protein